MILIPFLFNSPILKDKSRVLVAYLLKELMGGNVVNIKSSIQSGIKYSLKDKSTDELMEYVDSIHERRNSNETRLAIMEILSERGEDVKFISDEVEKNNIDKNTNINKSEVETAECSRELLYFLSWVYLALSVGGGVFLINSDKVGLSTGVAVIFQGIIMSSFFMVVCSIAKNISIIKNHMIAKDRF